MTSYGDMSITSSARPQPIRAPWFMQLFMSEVPFKRHPKTPSSHSVQSTGLK